MDRVRVGIVMGSDSDWGAMQHAARRLKAFGVPYEARVVSAHRTPDLLFDYAETAAARGLKCHHRRAPAARPICPACSPPRPRCRCWACRCRPGRCKGIDSLLSIVQMPKGVPVATFAIGEAGAENAALFAVALLALDDRALGAQLSDFREAQAAHVRALVLPDPE